MKKTVLFILFFFLTTFLFAQFTITKLDGTPITNGEIFSFTAVNQTINSTNANLYFTVNNTHSQDLRIKIRCNNLINTTGANFQLCYGFQCYEGLSVGTSYPDWDYILPPGGNNIGTGDAFKNFNVGDGVNYPSDYVFRFFALDSAGDQVGSNFNITYRYEGPLSIEQRDKLELMGVKVMNTKIQNSMEVRITKPVMYYVQSMQGQIIKSESLNTDSSIELSFLSTGIYLLTFKNNEGLHDTIKIYKN